MILVCVTEAGVWAEFGSDKRRVGVGRGNLSYESGDEDLTER